MELNIGPQGYSSTASIDATALDAAALDATALDATALDATAEAARFRHLMPSEHQLLVDRTVFIYATHFK